MDKMTEIPRIDEYDPAVIPDGHWIDKWGDEVWVKDGKWHREDGPAFINTHGVEIWYKEGKQHHADGPALVTPGGKYHWFLNDRGYADFEKWLAANDEITDKQKVFLKLKYG